MCSPLDELDQFTIGVDVKTRIAAEHFNISAKWELGRFRISKNLSAVGPIAAEGIKRLATSTAS
jgi:hypothetical protein